MRDKSQVILPLDLEICIPEGDFVFKVAEICDSLDYTELWETYVRAWRKVNPITMFEILVFAYINRKFSSREIEKVCKTDIRFMWLLGGEPAPSDSMITRFMRGHLAEVIEALFYQFVEKLYEMGEVKFKNLFVDGTKIEAYANKYTFVWQKAVEKRLETLNKKIETVLPVIAERYGMNTSVSLEDCYEALVLQAQWINLTFAKGIGKRKTQLQKDIELLEGSRFAASAMSGGTGRPWQSTITLDPTSVHTAIVLRWFWTVTSAQSSPACPMTSESRSPT